MSKMLMLLFSLVITFSAAAEVIDDFILALETGDLDEVKRLTAEGIDINLQYKMGKLIPMMPPIDGWTACMTAAVRNDTALLNFLIENGADPELKTGSKNTALYWAVRERKTEAAEMLIDEGSDVNAQNFMGETAVYAASFHLHFEILDKLFEKGADVNLHKHKTPLWAALRSGSAKIVKWLLQHGADTSPEDLIEASENSGSALVIKYLIDSGIDVKNHYGKTALYNLVKNGEAEGFSALIDAGAPPDSTLLFKAVSASRTQMVRKLLKSRVQLDFGCSELTRAAFNGDLKSIKKLIDNGLSVNEEDLGKRTALTAACAAGFNDIAEYLILSGADVNMNTDPPALHLAAAAGDTELCKMLLDAGADPDKHNENKISPLQAAARDGNASVIKLLTAAGAVPDTDYHFPFDPMIYAIKRNSAEIASALLEGGVNPFYNAGAGRTYMHWAAFHESNNVIGVLKKAGVPADILDNGVMFHPELKKTPLELIKGMGNFKTEEILKR